MTSQFWFDLGLVAGFLSGVICILSWAAFFKAFRRP